MACGVVSFGSLTSATFGGLTGTGMLSLANADSAARGTGRGNNNADGTYYGALSGGGGLTRSAMAS